MEIVDLLEYSERAQLREWFERNAATEKCCWIAMYRGKKKPEGLCLPYLDVVEEALCFGQIVKQGTAAGPEFKTQLPIVSGYVVRVNDYTAKVLR